MRIGHLGPYSIDNAGDVLVGYATRHVIRKLCPDVEISVFAPEAPQPFWRHEFGRDRGIDGPITPIDSLGPMTWARELDALVIGGGGVISSEPHFSSFLLQGDPAWSRNGPPSAWNAVGSQNEPWYAAEFVPIYQTVRVGGEQLAYASVRNRSTEKFLRRCGVKRSIEVVPDPALLMPAGDRQAGRHLLEAAGVSGDAFVIGLSVGNSIVDPRSRLFYERLFAGLDSLVDRSDHPVEIVVFPFGNVYGDPLMQTHAIDGMNRVLQVGAALSPLELWNLIGALDLYISPRFHSVIAAYAQNVPLLIVDEYLSDLIATSKLREFAVDASLEAYYLSPWLSTDPARKLIATFKAARANSISFAEALTAQRRRLDAHYREMLGALGLAVSGSIDVGAPR